jgi:hypothetical protein
MKESQLQSAFVEWFRVKFKDKLIFANANGGSRNLLEAVNLKRQGVLAGVPDLCIIGFPSVTYWIELKVKGNKPTKNQFEVMRKINSFGGQCVFWCDDLDVLMKYFSVRSDDLFIEYEDTKNYLKLLIL